MRICSQCQYKNPGAHRFCQHCGALLSDSVSSSELPSADNAALNSESSASADAASPSPREMSSVSDAASVVTWYVVCSPSRSDTDNGKAQPAPLIASTYLDSSQRYQILDDRDLTADSETSSDFEFQVRDCSPNAPSYLEQLYGIRLQPSCTASTRLSGLDESDIPTEPLGTPIRTIPPNRDLTLPAIAQLYLSLQSQLYPSFPQIHDAWQQDGNNILLLDDRSRLPSILTVLADESVLPFQVVSWLHYTTKLWDTLQVYGCCRSILKPDNLYVDEDGIICLQRLYLDPPTDVLNLCHLGHLWQRLFQQAQRTYLGPIAQLCYDLESSTITTVAHLQERLRLIADELQPSLPEDANMLPSNFSLYSDSQALTMNEHDLDSLQPSMPESVVRSEPLDDEVDLEDWQKTTRPIPAEQIDTELDGDDLPTVVLPMQLLSIEDAGRTDIGRQRKDNQDYFAIKTDVRKFDSPTGRSLHARGLYILCDGMGGHAGGEIASTLATQTLEQYFDTHWDEGLPDETTIAEGIRLANNAIYDLNVQNMRSGSGRMGTTLVLVLLQGTEVAIAHVGDSRLYRYSRRQGLEMLTVDHEVGQREIQRGMDPVEAYSHPEAYQLTQALGPRDQDFVHPDITFLEVNEDNVFLLCSDGLTDNDLIETYCDTYVEPLLGHQMTLEQGANQLIELANHYNGHDNISVILIRVRVRPNTASLRQE